MSYGDLMSGWLTVKRPCRRVPQSSGSSLARRFDAPSINPVHFKNFTIDEGDHSLSYSTPI